MIQAFTCKKNKPEISDLLRTRTGKTQMSYLQDESLSAKTANNVALSVKKSPSAKSIAAVKADAIPIASIAEEEDELAKLTATSVNQSSEITWL